MRIVDSHFHWWPESVIKGMMNREGFPRVEKLEESGAYRWHMARAICPSPPGAAEESRHSWICVANGSR